MIDGNTKFKNSPAKLELSEISHNSWRPPMDRDPHQIRHPMHFSNSPLQFFPFIWYKQFTESRSVAAGTFLFESLVAVRHLSLQRRRVLKLSRPRDLIRKHW